MFSSQTPFSHRLKCILFLIIFVPLLSCSSSQQTANFSPPANFNASNYINPEDYGYDLMNLANGNESNSGSFTPVDLNYRAMQKKMNYPKNARRAGIDGEVILQVYVDSTGTLTNMRVIQSPHDLLTKATKEAAVQTDFEAARLKGEPVNSFTRVSGHFQVRSRRYINRN